MLITLKHVHLVTLICAEFQFDGSYFSISRCDSSRFHKMAGTFTKAKQLLGSKPMSRRRQLSLARSAIAIQAIFCDESERNVDSPSNGYRDQNQN